MIIVRIVVYINMLIIINNIYYNNIWTSKYKSGLVDIKNTHCLKIIQRVLVLRGVLKLTDSRLCGNI